MVQNDSTSLQDSSGLLPSPSNHPKQGLPAKYYVGLSSYPLPFQAVVLLEGCCLDEVISWDLSVSSKILKIKIVWSRQAKSNSSYSLNEKLPLNILKAISTFDLARPSWSTSSSGNKLTFNINWPFLSSKPSSSPDISHTKLRTDASINHVFTSPISKVFHQNLDSGYQSNYSKSGCYGPNSHNWRQKISPVTNPDFSTPKPKKPKNDVYIPPFKSPDKSEVNHLSSPTEILDTKSTSLSIPISPSQPTEISPKVAPSNIESTENVISKSSKIQCDVSSLLFTSKTDIHPNSSKTSDYLPTSLNKISPAKLSTNCSKVTLENSESSKPLAASKNVFPSEPPASTTNVSIPQVKEAKCDFPTPPAGFPNKFFPTPKPLPLTEDGFLDPNTQAFFMNIFGKCRLCDSQVSSHLIDLHLLECSGLDHQPIDDFVKSVANKTPLKSKDIISSAKKYSRFELQENKVPNKTFKKMKHYKLFTSKLEDLTKILTKNAFDALNLPETLQNFNFLKYTN